MIGLVVSYGKWSIHLVNFKIKYLSTECEDSLHVVADKYEFNRNRNWNLLGESINYTIYHNTKTNDLLSQ